MEVTQIKKLAADILKCGISRIRIVDINETLQAMTRDDIRNLIKRNVIIKVQKIGVSRFRANKTKEQKKRGKRRGRGSRKGTKKARTPRKRVWITKVRALKKCLSEEKKGLQKGVYRTLYSMIKGGYFRTKDHLKKYIEEKGFRSK